MVHRSRRLLVVASLTLTATAGYLWTRPRVSPKPEEPVPPVAPISPPGVLASSDPEILLTPGIEIPAGLSGGEARAHPVDLPAGHFLHLTVQQDGVDVALDLAGPDGQALFQVDSPTGTTGMEELFYVARGAGIHTVTVRNPHPLSGRYFLRVLDLREATIDDRRRAEAEETFHRARTQPDLAQAVAGFTEAARLFEALGETERQADSFYSIGKQRDGEESTQPLERALSLYREAGVLRGEAATCNRLGATWDELGKHDRAEPRLRRALELGQTLEDREIEAIARTNLGKLLSRQGDYWEALSLLSPALSFWQAQGNAPNEGDVAAHLGNTYARMGQPDVAERHFESALRLVVEDPQEARRLRAVTLTYRGDALTDQRDFAGAAAALEEALRLRSDDPKGASETRNSLARLAYAQKDLPRARKGFQEVLDLARHGGNPRLELAARINLGWTEAASGSLDAGAALFTEALAMARALRMRPNEAAVLSGLAWIEILHQDLDAAEEHAEAAIMVIESLASDAERRELRASLLAGRHNAYNVLMDIWMERHRRDRRAGHDRRALAVSDRFRGRGLLADLDGPEGGFGRPLPLDEIRRAALADGSLLLVYHLGEKRSYLWAVDSQEIAVFELPGRERLERLAREVSDLVFESREPEMADRLRAKARELAGPLLGPVAGRLGERPLRIVADGELHRLNFGLLPDPNDPEGPWLLMRHEITYAPSASVLGALHLPRPHRPEPTGELALVGDGIALFRDDRLDEIRAFLGRDPGLTRFDSLFERLSEARHEIRAIQSIVRKGPVKTLVGFEATRDRILQGAVNGYRVLHFTTHGVADPQEAGRAALVLSWYDRDGHRLNGFLRARDVDQLRLSAELVVLSACETGLGESIRGEGLVGLSQSFLAAGASNVVVSLGKVPDDATSRLMPLFYKAMYQRGMTPPAALRWAQLELIRHRSWAAPYHWAGFVAQGAATQGQRRPPPSRTASRD